MAQDLPRVPLFSAEAAAFGLDLAQIAREVIDSHRYVMGPRVQAFETAFARYVGVGHAVSVGNGTDALELALRALGLGAGQRVATVANAGFYASTAIRLVGASPVYIDVEPASLTMSPAALASALEAQSVDAVIVTHLYGRLADMATLAPLCEQAGVPVIEDCAQAHGAEAHGRRAGAWGRVASFSFYPTKNLGALGDGGALTTDDAELAGSLRGLRQYGWQHKYEVTRAGGRNSRLDELQAAILAAKLPRLDEANAARRAIGARYNQAFSDLPLGLPPAFGPEHVAHLYVVRSERRAALRAHLLAAGVDCDIHYPIADHMQPVMRGQGATPSLPVTKKACEQVLSLPCFPGMRPEQAERVVAAVRRFFGKVVCVS
ncbi:MAG: DegT/DnrJ/EryC1/StrS family aminotransferase [Pseudomonadota bacterium]|nr:DegT/DnrJ/EryC1/StrS family aminotransferase [Pseudomonadota bacterium]